MKGYAIVRASAGALLILLVPGPVSSSQDHSRDVWQQPEAIMDSVGVCEGMTIGEAGAGTGYFTFHLARRVGPTGKVFANDIDRSALQEIEDRMQRDSVTNIVTIAGEVTDPRFPEGCLDMVIMMNAFHEFSNPQAWMKNVRRSMKPGATLVIIDRDPEKIHSGHSHFMTKEQILAAMATTDFSLARLLAFLDRDTVYIFTASDSP